MGRGSALNSDLVPLADPVGSSSFVAAIQWLEGALLGTIAMTVAAMTTSGKKGSAALTDAEIGVLCPRRAGGICRRGRAGLAPVRWHLWREKLRPAQARCGEVPQTPPSGSTGSGYRSRTLRTELSK